MTLNKSTDDRSTKYEDFMKKKCPFKKVRGEEYDYTYNIMLYKAYTYSRVTKI